VIDVQDVADLHLQAMTNLVANGERFLAVAGELTSMRDIAKVLKKRLGSAGKKVRTLRAKGVQKGHIRIFNTYPLITRKTHRGRGQPARHSFWY